jgi:hypothetical protein
MFFIKHSNEQGVADAIFYAGDYTGVIALVP